MSVNSYNSTNSSSNTPAGVVALTTPPATTNQLIMNKEIKKKFLKTFDLSQIAEDPMDIYLDTLGLWKKRIARDGSCLFRAVAEQIYPCQLHHERVRQECIRYMSDNREIFSKHVASLPFDEYLEAMKNPFEYGGQLEIAAMSKLYKRDFIIYHHPDQPGVDVTQNGYERNIFLCYSYNNHFDAIFSKSHRDNLALIQSLVYEILYEKVFGSSEQVAIARRLLRKSDTIYPKEYMNLRNLNEYDNELDIEEEDEEEEATTGEDEEDQDENSIVETNKEPQTTTNETDENNNENSTDQETINNNKTDDTKSSKLEASIIQEKNSQNASQKMPLPYKVAKSLDPVIYRNTAFDAWLAAKKEYEECLNQKALSSLHSGDKCFVRLNNNFMDKWNLAYLHSIQHDLANVFVVELNENHCVPLDNLKPFTNDMNQSGYYHHYYGGNFSLTSQSPSNGHIGSIKNVQKLVQSMNPQFSKIFLSADNKRRTNLKKKQFNLKKSYSFHAMSAELPTLIEVEEQLEDSYGANSHQYYFTDQSNPAFGNFSLAPTNYSMGFQPYMHPPHHHQHQQPHHHHMRPQMPHSQSYYSQPNQYSSSNENKLNLNASHPNSKLTTSISASNLSFGQNSTNKHGQLPTSQSANVITSNAKNNSNLLMTASNTNNSNQSNNNKNNRRNQRYNQNQQQQLATNYDSNKNPGAPHWSTPGGAPNSFFNTSNVPPPPPPTMNAYMPPNHTVPQPPPPPPPALMNMPSNLPPFTNPTHLAPFGSNMSLPPLVNQSGFIPPPPPSQPPQMGPIQQLGTSSMLPPPQFMHAPPGSLPPIASNQTNASSNQRQTFFNSNTNYMMGLPPQQPPPPPTQTAPNQITSNNYNSHLMNGGDYYFSNSNNNCNILFPNSTSLNYTNYSTNNSNTNSKFQTSNNQRKPDTKLDGYESQSTTSFATNTSNYLLMPAPCSKNTKNNATSLSSSSTKSNKTDSLNSTLFDSQSTSNLSSLPRSHSYHSGVSSQSYDLSQATNSNVYVDVYTNQTNSVAQQHQENNLHQSSAVSLMNSSTTTNNTTSTNNNASSTSSSCLNDLNNLINSNNSANYSISHSSLMNNSTSANTNPSANLDNSSLMYGSNNFQNYELQYPRFDNNLNDDTSFLINSSDRQMNLWNKNPISNTSTSTNKLITKPNGFNETLYNTNGATSMLVPPQLPTNLADKTNQQFCYSNCLVVNIDGPINFNATHSLLDDGSDLPFNDINTMRFFYNVGIEYYRLNLAAPYNQQNGYSTTCYAPPGQPPLQPVAQMPTMLLPPSNMPSSTSNTAAPVVSSTSSSSLPMNNTNSSTVPNISTSLGSLTQSQTNQTNNTSLGINNTSSSMNKTTIASKSETSTDANNNYVGMNSQAASSAPTATTSSSKNVSKTGSNRRY